jgi:hypothetical protein
MKKYLLGFLAVALAVGFSAFTNPAKKALTGYVFVYNVTTASGSYGPTAVADVANWDYLGESTNTCEELTAQVPCSFEVPANANFLDGSHPDARVLIIPSTSGSDRIVTDVVNDDTDLSIEQGIINKVKP